MRTVSARSVASRITSTGYSSATDRPPAGLTMSGRPPMDRNCRVMVLPERIRSVNAGRDGLRDGLQHLDTHRKCCAGSNARSADALGENRLWPWMTLHPSDAPSLTFFPLSDGLVQRQSAILAANERCLSLSSHLSCRRSRSGLPQGRHGPHEPHVRHGLVLRRRHNPLSHAIQTANAVSHRSRRGVRSPVG